MVDIWFSQGFTQKNTIFTESQPNLEVVARLKAWKNGAISRD